jgi:hypothetical protein
MSGKIEEMHPHYKTVLQALRYGLEILEDKQISDKEKVSRAKHQIKDAMFLLGYTEKLVRTYRKPSAKTQTKDKEE